MFVAVTTSTEPLEPPPFPRITHVALTVPDLERSIAWYRELFGSPPAFRQEEDGFRVAVWVRPLIGLHEHGGPRHTELCPPFDERVTGLDHVAFACADRGELEAWVQRLDEMGIKHGAIVDDWYGSALAFRDLDNIALEFFCPPKG